MVSVHCQHLVFVTGLHTDTQSTLPLFRLRQALRSPSVTEMCAFKKEEQKAEHSRKCVKTVRTLAKALSHG